MRRVVVLLMTGFLFAPTASADEDETRRVGCGVSHFLRNNNTEIGTTAITFRNHDLQHPVTIERITIRNAFGTVVHDSGPAIGVPHPLNADFSPPQDITVIPPGASLYLPTYRIWGLNAIPGDGGNPQGASMSAVVKFTTEGERPFVVGTSFRITQLPAVGGSVLGTDLARSTRECVKLN